MSRNRLYQTSARRHGGTKPLPDTWAEQQARGVWNARTKLPASSWWTQYAAPDARESFIVAAKKRDALRERKPHALMLEVDAQ